MSFWQQNIAKACLKNDSPLIEKTEKIIEYWVNKGVLSDYKMKKTQKNDWTILEYEYQYQVSGFRFGCRVNDELGGLEDVWSEISDSNDGSYIIEFYDSDYGAQVVHTGSVEDYEITDYDIIKDVRWGSGETMDLRIKLPLETWFEVTGCDNAEDIEDELYDNEVEILTKILGKDLFRILYKYDEYEIFETSEFDVKSNIVTFMTHNIWSGLTLTELIEFRENFKKAVELLKEKNAAIQIYSSDAVYKDAKSVVLDEITPDSLMDLIKQSEEDDKDIDMNERISVETRLSFEGFYYMIIETGLNYIGDFKVYGYKSTVD